MSLAEHYDHVDFSSPQAAAEVFEAERAEVLNIAIHHLGGEAVWMLAGAPENQGPRELSPTFQHQVAVGALMRMATPENVSEEEQHVIALTGFLHDIVKITDPEIGGLIQAPRKLTDDEFAVVRQHAPRGGEFVRDHLQISDLSPESLERIATAIERHHSDHEGDDLSALLQAADQGHAMLVDPHRKYRKARMQSEGLLDADGNPIISDITGILLSRKPNFVYGVPLRRLAHIAIDLMPPLEQSEQVRAS